MPGIPEKKDAEKQVSPVTANDGHAVTGESLIRDLLSPGFVTRTFKVGNDEFVVKTLKTEEYMLFLRLFDWRVNRSREARPISSMMVEQIRSECLLPFVVYSYNNTPFSPITEDVLKAWREMYLYNKTTLMDQTFTSMDAFLEFLFQNYLGPKLLSIADVVVQKVTDIYNQMLKEIEQVFKGGELKKA